MGIIVDYSVNTGSFNMDFDENILETCIEKKEKSPVLRLYGWSPACVSLGRNQKIDSVDQNLCNELGIDIVRRKTGGRALLHDKELTYSFVCPVDFLDCGESIIKSYKEISNALIVGLKELNINVSFPENKKVNSTPDYCMSLSTGADLSYNGKKIIGSAQVRKNNYILQHGSILIDLNKELIKKLFHEEIKSTEITFLKEIDSNIDLSILINSIKVGFEKQFNQKFNQLYRTN